MERWCCPALRARECEGFTSFCELRVLRGILNPIRSYLGARGKRRKPTRANAFPIIFDGEAASEDIALAEYPVSLIMPILECPGFLVGRDPAHYNPSAFDFRGWFAPDAEAQALKLMRERGVTEFAVTHDLHPRAFIFNGFKLFYHQDVRMFSAREVLQMRANPDLVTYE